MILSKRKEEFKMELSKASSFPLIKAKMFDYYVF